MLFAPILHTYFMCHGAHVPSIFLFLRCGPNVRNSVIKPQKHSSSIRARVVSNVAELSYLNIVPRDDPDIRRYRRSPSARLVVAPTWYESSLHVRLRELEGDPSVGSQSFAPLSECLLHDATQSVLCLEVQEAEIDRYGTVIARAPYLPRQVQFDIWLGVYVG